MKNNAYSLGLSSFSHLTNECIVAAGVYRTRGDWPAVKNLLIEENLLQKTHRSTAIVTAKEVTKRLKQAYPWELEVLAAADDLGDCSFVCMLLVARKYRLLADITTDLLHYKFEGGDVYLEPYEIDFWYRKTAAVHPEIDAIKPGSYKRLVGNTRLILLNGGLLRHVEDERLMITRPQVTGGLERRYREEGSEGDLRMMLRPEGEITMIMGERG